MPAPSVLIGTSPPHPAGAVQEQWWAGSPPCQFPSSPESSTGRGTKSGEGRGGEREAKFLPDLGSLKIIPSYCSHSLVYPTWGLGRGKGVQPPLHYHSLLLHPPLLNSWICLCHSAVKHTSASVFPQQSFFC